MIQHPKYLNNPLLNLTFNFSIDIIQYAEYLEELRKYNLANQLFRCVTSIGANSNESQNCESRADFVHKLKIAAKEAEETEYWLLLCEHSKNYPKTSELLNQLEQIQKLLNKIISSSKNNGKS